MTTNKTTLNAIHRAMGAKMVDFGGWDMPLNYGSQIDEHHRVRRDCGMFDVSHMRVVDIKGEGARTFLRYLLANNVDKLDLKGRALYSTMLLQSGGVIDDLIVYFMNEEWFRIVVNAATADKDIKWMKQQAAQHVPQLNIRSRNDLAMIAVQGPNARERVWQVLPEIKLYTEKLKPFFAEHLERIPIAAKPGKVKMYSSKAAGKILLQGDIFIARTGYTGEDGFEVVLPKVQAEEFWNALNKAGVAPIGLAARDTLRLEAGMNLYGQDMDETASPLESGLAWTVDLKSPRDFMGRAALLAHPPQRSLVGLVLLDRGVLRSHQKVITAHGEGEITSGTFSPTLEKSIAFARVPSDVQTGDKVEVAIRDKMLTAQVVKYPFVRNGKSCIVP